MGAPRPTISIDALKEFANARVLEICNHLLPNGRENCGLWEVGSIAGEPGQSMKVNLRGATRGLWTDFSTAKGTPEHAGNIIQLVAQVQFRGDVGKACQWLRSWLGLDHMDPERLGREKAKVARRLRDADKQAAAKADRNRRKAHGLFVSAVDLPGTPAETYLISRGIDLRGAGHAAPGSIKFHPEVWCAETNTKLPCMVAAINAIDGRHIGTHRTWLQPDGSGKATLVEPKKSIGKYQGGYIQLWKGAHKCHLRDLPEGTPIYVSEGIEDGLSAALAKPQARVIAGISLSNIGGLVLPERCPIHILGQRDTKMQAIEAFEGAVKRLQERGHQVFLISPPEGFKDYNDVLRGTPCEQAGGA